MTMKRITPVVLAALFAAMPLAASIDNAGEQRERSDRADRERERQEQRVERESDMYDEGTDALDEKDYAQAARIFRRVAQMQGEHADAALYWLARSQKE